MNDFWKENDLDGSQGDLRALGHPQRPRQAQPWGVQQVPFIFIKMNIWNMFHERFSKTKRPGWVPRWSEGSRTPSATSTNSTMGSTANIVLWGDFHVYFVWECVLMWAHGATVLDTYYPFWNLVWMSNLQLKIEIKWVKIIFSCF